MVGPSAPVQQRNIAHLIDQMMIERKFLSQELLQLLKKITWTEKRASELVDYIKELFRIKMNIQTIEELANSKPSTFSEEEESKLKEIWITLNPHSPITSLEGPFWKSLGFPTQNPFDAFERGGKLELEILHIFAKEYLLHAAEIYTTRSPTSPTLHSLLETLTLHFLSQISTFKFSSYFSGLTSGFQGIQIFAKMVISEGTRFFSRFEREQERGEESEERDWREALKEYLAEREELGAEEYEKRLRRGIKQLKSFTKDDYYDD